MNGINGHKAFNNQSVGLLGLPVCIGQPHPGVSETPAALRASGLVQSLEALDLRIVDFGDVQLVDSLAASWELRLQDPGAQAVNAERISRAVADSVEHLADDGTLLCIGGDHSMSLGSIHGHASLRPELSVVWVDAHTDCHTTLTSESNNFHGMPLSFLIKEFQPLVPRIRQFDCIRPCIKLHNLAYIGLRDVDAAECELLQELGAAAVYSMRDIDELGICTVVRQCLQQLDALDRGRPIHLSFDIDALDPSVVASTGTPVAGGLTQREALCIAEILHSTGNLKVVDLAEVNPQLGSKQQQQQTISTARDLLLACCGRRRSGNRPKSSTCHLPEPRDFGCESRAATLMFED